MRPTLTLRGFRRLALASTLALGLIVVTGGAVRLTGSGLGCSTWPQCEPGRLVPPLGVHQWVEFGNRLVTLAVLLVVLATALGAHRLAERRRDLTWLSWGLVAGVLAQAVIGGLSVRYRLVPGWVIAHFLASMLVLADAVVLWSRAVAGGRAPSAVVRREVVWLGRALAVTAGAALAAGTVVTGTGPHAGDASAVRLHLRLTQVTQLHADIGFFLSGLVVATVVALRLADAPAHVRRWGRWLLAVVLAQVAVGELQYALHLPAALVAVHIAGATALWTTTLLLNVSFRAPAPAVPSPAPTPASESESESESESTPRDDHAAVGSETGDSVPTPA